MSPFIYFELIRVASGYAGIFSIGIITFERVIATIYIQTYEKNTHTHVAVPTIFVIWMFGILSAVLGYGSKTILFAVSLVVCRDPRKPIHHLWSIRRTCNSYWRKILINLWSCYPPTLSGLSFCG